MPKQSKGPAKRVAIAIMAAGKGTRLKSKHPKVLHEVGGKPLLSHVIAAASRIVPPADIFVIIGHEADRVRQAVAHSKVNFVLQENPRGTGHALMVARQVLAPYDTVIVLSGDAPLISSETLEKLHRFHLSKRAAMTLLSAQLADPTGYGRVLRKSPKGAEVKSIVEDGAATVAEHRIREVNSGFYAFERKALFDNIDKLKNANAQGEFYLTDMARLLGSKKARVVALATERPQEILGSNTRAELVSIDQHLRAERCRQLMAEGVTIFYPQTCVIDPDVEIGCDTVIEPFVQILGQSRIGADCRVGSYTVIRNSRVHDGVSIRSGCILDEAEVHSRALVGPFSHLRLGTQIGEDAKVGNFVETKKMRLGKDSKANHLAYLGDVEIGDGANIGAGTITCNYDGVRKHTTRIGDGVFVGSNSTLVAPLTLGQGAYVGAASCITQDVPEDALALGRAHQTVKPGWARARRETLSAKTK
jgi:bifunctional UDP-N-acetylglucosamine pyrophosphorylase/glucosamine-1-phosphate N-acetyltransferase